jgi:hypothetical protein
MSSAIDLYFVLSRRVTPVHTKISVFSLRAVSDRPRRARSSLARVALFLATGWGEGYRNREIAN